ncbi:MAG: glycosyltransferase family 2 protein [Planctomycetota bacterium]
MKLIIQIPCYNEEETLAEVLADLPEAIPGVDQIETLVIDDGSEDETVRVAEESGVDHIVNLPRNRGLASAWSAGIDAALRQGADIIVNTDADNQYVGADIVALVRPILSGEAEIVIGARPIEDIEHFSWLKKRLQRLGSWVVTRVAGVAVPDAASGFRAYAREAALTLNVSSPQYTHTADTIIRAARKGMTIRSVPVRVNKKLRESRLIGGTLSYVWHQAVIIFRVFTMLQPLKVFGVAAALLMLLGLAGCVRFLVFYFSGHGSGHVQSLLLSAILIIVAFVVGMIGLAADMIAANRQLIEDSLYRLKRMEMGKSSSRRVTDESDR